MTEAAPPVPASAEDQGPVEPVLLPPRGLVPTVLALFLLTAFAAVGWAPALRGTLPPSLRLDLWRQAVDLDELRARDAALLRIPRDAKAEGEIVQGFRHYLHDEARLGAETLAQRPESRETLGEIEEHVRTLVAARGQDALRALAVAYGRDVRAAVEAALRAAQKDHQNLATFLQGGAAEARALTELTGGLGRALASTGLDLLQHGGRLDPAAGQVVEALAQQRVLQLGQRVPSGPPALPSDGQLLLLRFRIEAHEGLSIERKLRLLEELAVADPGAPIEYLRAVLLARAGQWQAAQANFLQAAARGQMPEQARVNARFCGEQAQARR